MRLIYLSPLPWSSLTQRPHEFVHYFHRETDGEVLWIDPYPTRLPALADFRRGAGGNGEHPRLVPPWLYISKPAALPLEPLPLLATLNRVLWQSTIRQACDFASAGPTTLTIGKPSAMALALLKGLPVVNSIYDAMDDFPAFYSGLSRVSMSRYEQATARRVSRILVSSTQLLEKFVGQSCPVTLVPNACRYDVTTIKMLPPHSFARPIIGYVGTLGKWFDWDLVSRLAQAHPNCVFRLIGPLFSGPASTLPSNIEIRPPLEHALALEAMRDFAVGLIPFKLSRLTASVDPIKYYEYRAMGLPVISSAFGEMALRDGEDGVFLLRAGDSPIEVLENALAYQSDEQSSNRFIEKNSWGARFAAAKLFV
jgi:hypothetical protein